MEKFRIGLIGCGVISDIYLKTCQKLDILDVTACASLNIEEVKKVWPLAYDVRKEERLKGVSHYLSPKANLDNIRLSMYHSGSVPLNVGLFVNAEIEGLLVENVVVLPRNALRNGNRVLIVDAENRLHFRDIEPLRLYRDQVLVQSGLAAG